MKLRHETKHDIRYSEYLAIKSRLQIIAMRDRNASEDGTYRIRSLYFDNYNDKALREKIDGVYMREKFRIRYYNDDLNVIHLEKKTKIGGLGNKQSELLTKEEVKKILNGNIDFALTIRTMLLKNGKAYVQAGAGIVAASNPEHEYMETVNKAKSLLEVVLD